MANSLRTNVLCLLIILLSSFAVQAQTVVLDYYFNHEVHINSAGKQERYHYTWEDTANSGFSILGGAFKKQGVKLDTLGKAPTRENLNNANIYIIVDPDTRKENIHPNYIERKDIKAITQWVEKGGVLLILANDSANVELPQFNKLALVFGMHFNNDLQNHVASDKHFEDGAILTAGNPIFKTTRKIFMKDVCSIGIIYPAVAALRNKNNAVIIATEKYGNGYVMAVGDPWLYNEYTNGRLPAGFENDKAADDIAKWLIGKIHN